MDADTCFRAESMSREPYRARQAFSVVSDVYLTHAR